jgi:hypothetical protein
MKLLDLAKQTPLKKKTFDAEEVLELTLAYLKGDVEIQQVNRALGRGSSASMHYMAYTLFSRIKSAKIELDQTKLKIRRD